MTTRISTAPLECEVRLRVQDYPNDWDMSPAMWECWIVGKLKEAGVPVIGTLTLNGIKSGTLHRFDDPKDFGSVVYKWVA